MRIRTDGMSVSGEVRLSFGGSLPPGTRLETGALHVWATDLDASEGGEDPLSDSSLSPQELARARRFARAQDAHRWARSRGVLRELLGRYLGQDPGSVGFAVGEQGKPELEERKGPIEFNLSHSGSLAVYAFSSGTNVGVDVELPGRPLDVLALAERAFGPDVARRLGEIQDAAARKAEFLRLWVTHEARLKCLGVGLAGARGAQSEPRWIAELDLGTRWSEAGAVAAVATKDEPPEVRCWWWAP